VVAVSQIIGGIVGAAMARGMSPGAFRAINGGANRLSIGWRSAFMGEIFGTMLLVGAFLVAYDRRRRLSSDTVNVLAPWMLGMAVTAAHLFLVPYTWCSINPGTHGRCCACWYTPSPRSLLATVWRDVTWRDVQPAASARQCWGRAGAPTGCGGSLPSSALSEVSQLAHRALLVCSA
jgi:glycerol uptake facilitator-like aquaporin